MIEDYLFDELKKEAVTIVGKKPCISFEEINEKSKNENINTKFTCIWCQGFKNELLMDLISKKDLAFIFGPSSKLLFNDILSLAYKYKKIYNEVIDKDTILKHLEKLQIIRNMPNKATKNIINNIYDDNSNYQVFDEIINIIHKEKIKKEVLEDKSAKTTTNKRYR